MCMYVLYAYTADISVLDAFIHSWYSIFVMPAYIYAACSQCMLHVAV